MHLSFMHNAEIMETFAKYSKYNNLPFETGA